MERFAEEIKHRLGTLGLSQAELARRAGVTERAFNHYMSGRSEPSLATLVRVSDVLGCTPNDLLLGSEGVASREKSGKLLAQANALCQCMDERNLMLAIDILKCIANPRVGDREH